MANVLLTTGRLIFNVFLIMMTKAIIFLLTIFKFLATFVGYQRVQRRRYIREIRMERYEPFSRYMGSITLARYESPEETIIYAKCLDSQWEPIIKGLLQEKKEDGAKTYCYLYNDNAEDEDVEGIRVPPPVSVAFLNSLFDYSAE